MRGVSSRAPIPGSIRRPWRNCWPRPDFSMPVVDVDRVRLRYPDLDALVRDLRAMAATSVLAERAPPMSKAELHYARQAFFATRPDGRTEEIVEILHFLAWTK